MTKFFAECKTLEDLKKLYHKLAVKFHPDLGGDPEVMKAINNEYDEVFPKLKNIHFSNTKQEYYTKETDESADFFKDIIDKLIKMDGLKIEVVGCFIWLSGNTMDYKDKIKEMSFKWSANKKMWYLAPKGYRKFSNKNFTYDDICGMYGVQYSATGKGDKDTAIAIA